MSIEALSWAFKQNLPPAEKLVLLSLADHHNKGTGVCIPGQASIAEQTSMSVRTVQRHLQQLEVRGLIARHARFRGEGRGRTSDGYILQGDNLTPMPVQGDRPRTTKATIQDDQRDTGVVALTGREPEEEPTSAPTKSPRRERPKDDLWDALAAAVNLSAKPTSSERGRMNAALKELREIGATPEDIADRAKVYRRKHPDMPCTPQALTGNWSLLGGTRRPPATCRDCTQPLDRHDQETCDAFRRQ